MIQCVLCMWLDQVHAWECKYLSLCDRLLRAVVFPRCMYAACACVCVVQLLY